MRFKEHKRATEKNKIESSAVAKHMNENNHTFNINNLKLKKQVTDKWKLDAYESIAIQKTPTHLRINEDDGPLYSPLFVLV